MIKVACVGAELRTVTKATIMPVRRGGSREELRNVVVVVIVFVEI